MEADTKITSSGKAADINLVVNVFRHDFGGGRSTGLRLVMQHTANTEQSE